MKFKNEINQLLEIILPQYFDAVTEAVRKALYQIDPSWQMGQFKIFSRNFRSNILKSFFTRRFSLNTSRVLIITGNEILEQIRQVSQDFNDYEKAALYGQLLSQYILLCPKEHFPVWLKSYKKKPNWQIVWHTHSELWKRFYW
jgi:hypothetical protein